MENEPLVRETNFTLGPIQKPLYLLLLYQFTFAHYRPKSDISGALGPIHNITLKAFAMALGDVFAFSFNLAGTLYVAKKTIFKPDLHKNIERLPILNLV